MTAGRSGTPSRRRLRPAPFRTAVMGKGGSGKSMVAGTLARALARRGHRVLALDSDPVPGLALTLGVEPGSRAMLEEYAERGPDGRWRVVRGLKPATLVRRAALPGPDGVLFLQYGKVESASLAPVAASLQAFWHVTQGLEAGRWTVVHDLPAGTRQAFSGWASKAHLLLLVVEPTQKSILSARRLLGVRELAPDALMVAAANKIRSGDDVSLVAAALPGVEVIARVPFDAAVAAAERAGRPPIDHVPEAPAVRAVTELAERLESIARKEAP